MTRLHDYLQHICQAIERIGVSTQGMDEAAFLNIDAILLSSVIGAH